MEAKKNLCGMIPENLHAKAIEEKEQLGLKTLGDYVESIKRYGTIDSYSTEPVGPRLFSEVFA